MSSIITAKASAVLMLVIAVSLVQVTVFLMPKNSNFANISAESGVTPAPEYGIATYSPPLTTAAVSSAVSPAIQTVTLATTQTLTMPLTVATSTQNVTQTSTVTTTSVTTTSSSTLFDPSDPNSIVAFVIFALVLVVGGFLLRIRSKLTKDLAGQRHQVVQLIERIRALSESPPESPESALRRLLDLGLLSSKEYMDKRVSAERLSKKSSPKKLLDEGRITREQYDRLVGKDEQQ